MGRVLIAPDKFKGTLTAAQVAAHVAAGLGRVRPGVKPRQVQSTGSDPPDFFGLHKSGIFKDLHMLHDRRQRNAK